MAVLDPGTCMHDDLTEPMSDEAPGLPGDFLLDRAFEHDCDASVDEGGLVVPELDGFLTAIFPSE